MSLQLEPERFFPAAHAMQAKPGWGTVEPGRLVSIFVQFPPMPLPRTTRRGWFARSKRYMAWRDAVRFETFVQVRQACISQKLEVWEPGTPLVASPVRLWIAVGPGGIGPTADLSNVLKAVEDALVGHALEDDRVKILKDTRALELPGVDPTGFSLLLEHLEAGDLPALSTRGARL